MGSISEYIDFSIKYRYLVGNKLPIELKYIIWLQYCRLLAIDKIIRISNKYKQKCEDCDIIRNPFLLKYVPACSEHYIDGYECCWKLICRGGCKIKLDCGCIKHFKPYQQVNKFNSIECCNQTNNLEFTWWGASIEDYLYKY